MCAGARVTTTPRPPPPPAAATPAELTMSLRAVIACALGRKLAARACASRELMRERGWNTSACVW